MARCREPKTTESGMLTLLTILVHSSYPLALGLASVDDAKPPVDCAETS